MTTLWTRRTATIRSSRRRDAARSLRAGLFSQRRRIATVAAAVLAAGVGYHVVFGHNGLTVFGAKRHETQTLERELKTLTHENDSLADHVERLKSDPAAIEHQAREELHYTRQGEVIVTMSPERTPDRTPDRTPEKAPEKAPDKIPDHPATAIAR